jgi:IclR family transcriptional regulator, acetate operon repressor
VPAAAGWRDMPVKKRQSGSAGARTLQVLHAVTNAQLPLALPEISDLVGLPKPTVHRIVALLEEEGYLLKDETGRRFVPGPALHDLAYKVFQCEAMRGPQHLILQQLAKKVGEACNIVLLEGDRITYLDRVDSAWPLRLRFDVGSHVPLHCTATGKLLLALQPKRVRDRLIASLVLEPKTRHTITQPEDFQRELARTRREEVGIDNEEFIEGMACIAVPIRPPRGAPIVAVSIHASIPRRSLAELRAILPDLREAARELAPIMYG